MAQITADSMLIVGPRRGRPPRAGCRSTVRIEFVATASERAELGRVAIEQGKQLATVIRDAVNEYVADYAERRVFVSRPPFE